MPRSPVIGLPYSDIFDNILNGFDQQLGQFFGTQGTKLKVVPLTNDDQLSEAAKKSNQDKIGFPFFARRYNTIEPITDQRNTFLMRFDGLSLKDKANNWYQFRLMPIRITLTLNFLCLDEINLRLFTQRWIDASRLHYLDYNLLIYDNPIKIRIDAEATITYPEFTGDETGSMFNCETTCSIVGYYGSITPVKTIGKLNLNTYQVNPNAKNGEVVLDSDTYTVRSDGIYNGDDLVREKPK